MALQAFDRLAGTAAVLVAIGGIAYSVSFVVAVKAPSEAALNLSWVLLLLGGLLGTALLPNALDPRGIMTFGLTGLGLLVLSWLIRRGRTLPANLGSLGVILGALMILVYLGRLLIIDPTNPALLGIAGITGLIAHPWWFFWLGRSLLR